MNNFETAIRAALKAGKAVLSIYDQDFDIKLKDDDSPLTEADKKSNKIITTALQATGIPIISEEIKNKPYEDRQGWTTCWIVDPLDGTKEFIKKNGEFTINIALVHDGVPVMGVVYWPTNKKLYFASQDLGSFVASIPDPENFQEVETLLKESGALPVQNYPETYTVVASRSHNSPETIAFIDRYAARYGKVDSISRGSSIKLCMVAEGKAHIYPRLAPTMEWDTAAAHAVAKYAGCIVIDPTTKEELRYNKEDLLNPHFIVLRNAKEDLELIYNS